MPLYLVSSAKTGARTLVYAKTPRGAENHILNAVRSQLETKPVTPIEAACLAKEGVDVETVGKGPDVVMADDPPEARRGEPVEVSTTKSYDGPPAPWEDDIPEGEENSLFP